MTCNHAKARIVKDFGFVKILWCPECGALSDGLSKPGQGWEIPAPSQIEAEVVPGVAPVEG